MSVAAQPATARLHREMAVTLTRGERWAMGGRLGSAALGGGLLLVSAIFNALTAGTDQSAVANLAALAAAVIAGAPILIAGVRGFLAREIHSYTEQLVSIAILAAISVGEFTTAALIPFLMTLGHFLQERSVLGAQAAIEGLRELHARKATVITPAGEREVAVDQLRRGDVVLIRPGDTVPADGKVLEGRSSIDQASITGEAIPEDVWSGSQVFAGTANLTGLLRVEVTGVGDQTALGRVLSLLQAAERSKAPITRLLERYATYYLPLVLLIAAVVLFLTKDLNRAIAILVVSCPCAFVLSSPAAMVAALAAASRLGILIKNTKFLEAVGEVNTLVLDKTGTVTLGQLTVVGVLAVEGSGFRIRNSENGAAEAGPGPSEEEMLVLAARLGAASRHPASRAVVAAVRERGLPAEPFTDVEEIAGQGLVGRSDGLVFRLGRREWLVQAGLTVPEIAQLPNSGPGRSTVWLSRDGDVLGLILLADTPRPEAREALEEARLLGVGRTVLLTGDRKEVAAEIGRQLGFDSVVAEVLPEQKLQVVRQERTRMLAARPGVGMETEVRARVMVVGDGVNDALALASGDVGVAMGAMGSEVALRSADVALTTNDLRRIPSMIRLSRGTRRIINGNVLFGIGFAVVMTTLAALGIVGALLAAVFHNVSTVFVVVNSARLLKYRAVAHISR
jgi:Cd2+/Zn2+-exporting ATPase